MQPHLDYTFMPGWQLKVKSSHPQIYLCKVQIENAIQTELTPLFHCNLILTCLSIRTVVRIIALCFHRKSFNKKESVPDGIASDLKEENAHFGLVIEEYRF